MATPIVGHACVEGRLAGESPGQDDTDRFTFTIDAAMAQQVFDLVVDTDVAVEITLFDGAHGNPLQGRRGSGPALRSLRLDEGTYGVVIAGGAGAYGLSFRPIGSPQSGAESSSRTTRRRAPNLSTRR